MLVRFAPVRSALERSALERFAAEAGQLRDQDRAAQAKIEELISAENQCATQHGKVETAIMNYRAETARLRETMQGHHKTVELLGQVPCDDRLQGLCQFTQQAVNARDIDIPNMDTAIRNRVEKDEDILALLPEAEILKQCQETLGLLQLLDPWSHLHTIQHDQQGVTSRQQEFREEEIVIRSQLTALHSFTKLLPELEQAELSLQVVMDGLAGVEQDLQAVQGTINRLDLAQSEKRALISDKDEITTKLADIVVLLNGIQVELQLLNQELGRVTTTLEEADRASREIEELQKALEMLSRDQRQFAVLEDSYKLIPVLVMENAIPLLEQEANRILERISPSGMRVRLDTQKALKSKEGLAETLEIIVRDVLGERPYENYSGGERFRLGLALRIGLSKLLAHRAGAKMETLIIDEGLGTLDEDGLLQLRECLGKLEEDFPLVLVISHVEAVKGTFPTEILVTKNSAGSHVEVLR